MTYTDKRKGVFYTYGPVGCVCLFMFMIVPALTYLAPTDKREVAVIFPFTYSAQQTFAQISKTDARIIRSGLSDNILIVAPQSAGFAKQIKTLGAWFLVDPLFIGACQAQNAAQNTLKNKG